MNFLSEIAITDFLVVLQLIIIEGLLSFDNALALAALVKKRLPNIADQKKALTWGIWGAYVFRTIVIFIGVWLMKHEWVKLVAGLYLVWIAIDELFLKKDITDIAETEANYSLYFLKLPPLWSAIVSVEIMDIMFSIDSIGVALAISNKKWILILGAILGIMAMRLAAQMFITLIDKFPVLEKTAFVLVGIAGINVILKIKDLPLWFATLTIDKEIPEGIFMGILFGVLITAMILNKLFPEKFAKKDVIKLQ